jgi:hypothetical protein
MATARNGQIRAPDAHPVAGSAGSAAARRASDACGSHLGQPHRRGAGTEAGQQQVKVSALCGGPVKVLARGHEGHGSLRKQEGSVTRSHHRGAFW